MTVVGLQKNLFEALRTEAGDSNGTDQLSGSGSSKFLQILSMLADKEVSDINELKATNLKLTSTVSILEGNKVSESIPQLTSIKLASADAPNGLNIPVDIFNKDVTEVNSEAFSEENNISELKPFYVHNSGEKGDEVLFSFEENIAKIQRAIEIFKTSSDAFSHQIIDKNTISVTDEGDDNTNDSKAEFIDLLYSHSDEFSETLNLKVLDDPNKNFVFLNFADLHKPNNETEILPRISKFFMSPQTKSPGDLTVKEIVKVSVKLGSEHTNIQLINPQRDNEIETIKLVNRPEDVLSLEIDKSNISALSVSISNEPVDDLSLSSKGKESNFPEVVLIFDKFLASKDASRPTSKIIESQKNFFSVEAIDQKNQTAKIPISDFIRPDYKPKSSFELAKLETINFERKFSEVGLQVSKFDNNQIKNILDNLINTLSLFKTKEVGVVLSQNNFADVIQKYHHHEQLGRAASLVVSVALNVETPSLRSKLLSSTSDVLSYKQGMQKFIPKISTPYNNLITGQDDQEVVFPLQMVSTKEQDKAGTFQPARKLLETNAVDAKSGQTQTQTDILPAPAQNTNQAQVASSVLKSSFSLSNSLQVFDTQFNSRLGLLLTDRVLSGHEKFELQLEPESFGKVRVSVSIDNSALEVKMVAENTGAVSILRNAESLLHSITDQSGLKLSNYSVEMQGGSGNNKDNSYNEGTSAGNSNETDAENEDINGNDLKSNSEISDQVLNLLA